MRSVSLMKSCGLALMNICWVGRIIIMRVGCIARTLVALNMLSVCRRSVGWSGEWRVSSVVGDLVVSSQGRWGSSMSMAGKSRVANWLWWTMRRERSAHRQ